MHENQILLKRFYSAFQQRNAKAMTACYHPQIRFSDPVFTDLRGAEAGEMWDMLCTRAGQDFKLEYRELDADAAAGSAHWEAWYTFSGSGRKVHNIIEATFEFREGLILNHRDDFDLHRWAAQALGLSGRLLGGLPLLQNKVRAKARRGLEQWMERQQ